MQVLVVGAGVVGLAVARTAALAGHDVIVAEATGGIGNGVSSRNSEVDSRRHLLSDRLAARPPLHARPAHAVRILRLARRRPQQMRQAHRRDRPGRACQGRGAAGAGTEERRRRAGDYRRQRRARARAGIVLHRRIVVAGIRHHRQPRLHAGAVGRASRIAAACIAFETPVERLSYAGAALAGAIRRPRRRHRSIRRRGECGGPRRSGAGAQDRGLPGRESAAARPRQGQLFRLRRPAGVLAADLSDAGRWRARRACHPRPCRPHAVRPGRRMDRSRRATRSIPAVPIPSISRIRTYWPGLPAGSLVPDYCGIRPKLPVRARSRPTL